jgi:hypothetical protein
MSGGFLSLMLKSNISILNKGIKMDNTTNPPVMPTPQTPQPPQPMALPQVPTPIGMQPQPNPPQVKKKSKLPLILIIITVIVVLGGIGTFAFLAGIKDNTPETPIAPTPTPEPTPTNTTLVCTVNSTYSQLPEYTSTGATSYDFRITLRFDTEDEFIDLNSKGTLNFDDNKTAQTYYNITAFTTPNYILTINDKQVTIAQSVKVLDMTVENATSFGVPGITISETGEIIKDKTTIKTAIEEQGYRCN